MTEELQILVAGSMNAKNACVGGNATIVSLLLDQLF